MAFDKDELTYAGFSGNRYGPYSWRYENSAGDGVTESGFFDKAGYRLRPGDLITDRDSDALYLVSVAGEGKVVVVPYNGLWTTDNMGPSSGLDADTVDGEHASALATVAAGRQAHSAKSADDADKLGDKAPYYVHSKPISANQDVHNLGPGRYHWSNSVPSNLPNGMVSDEDCTAVVRKSGSASTIEVRESASTNVWVDSYDGSNWIGWTRGSSGGPEFVTVGSSKTLADADSGKTLWVTDDVTLTLPAWRKGLIYEVMSDDPGQHTITVSPDGSDTIRGGADTLERNGIIVGSPKSHEWVIVDQLQTGTGDDEVPLNSNLGAYAYPAKLLSSSDDLNNIKDGLYGWDDSVPSNANNQTYCTLTQLARSSAGTSIQTLKTVTSSTNILLTRRGTPGDDNSWSDWIGSCFSRRWSRKTSTRSAGTTYTNTKPYEIEVSISVKGDGIGISHLAVDGASVSAAKSSQESSSERVSLYAAVPAGLEYELKIYNSNEIYLWEELY
jgi:hypothetical protein